MEVMVGMEEVLFLLAIRILTLCEIFVIKEYLKLSTEAMEGLIKRTEEMEMI